MATSQLQSATLQVRLSSSPSPFLQVTVTASINAKANTPILTLPSSGLPLQAYLNVTSVGFTPTSYTWSWVADSLNSFAIAPTSTSPFGPMAQQTKFTVSAEGIYQFVVTATDGSTSATKNVWVNIWSYKPALNPDRSVGNNPGLNPPSSIRVLSPDPGPFNHPRLLFTTADWPDLSQKASTSLEVSNALNFITTTNSTYFDSFGTTMNNLAIAFSEYDVSNYSDGYYTTLKSIYESSSSVTGDQLLGKNPSSSIYDALVCACYVEWLKYDASLPITGASSALQQRFTYLASVIAGAAQFELNYYGSGGFLNYGNSKFNLAICYDIAYNWMSSTQQQVTRNYLYATGYGIFNNGRGGLSYTAPYVFSGSNQNGGDFPNLADGSNLSALAIEGEESTVPAAVQALFVAYSSPITTAWPGASASSASNLHRQIRHNSEWNLTRWGFATNMVAYLNLGQNITSLAALAFARRWENQFVTTHIYQSCLAVLYTLAVMEKTQLVDLVDHHDSAGMIPGNNCVGSVYISKYMYPDDPATDYLYRVLKREINTTIYPLGQAIFAADPFTSTLSAVAAAKGMGNLKFDPHRTACISRNGWLDTDLMLQFENRWDSDGHMHTEKNNFSLYALGRAWANPAGYHITINDLQASILVQIPSLSNDPATAGYIGQSPSSATQTLTNSNFPPVPGRLLEVREDPAQLWTIFSGDAGPAYTYAQGGGLSSSIDTGVPMASLLYPSLTGALLQEDLAAYMTGNLSVSVASYNPVYNAKRTVFTVRDASKAHPYVLVLDDFTKDGTARNYRWSMPNCISFGSGSGAFVDANNQSVYSSLAILSGTATPTEVVVYHDPIDRANIQGQVGLPRLLVRDVANIPGNSSQPNIFIDDRPYGNPGGNLTYGVDNNHSSGGLALLPSRRLMIERDAVVSPGYQVLLYPFLSNPTNQLPTTTWTTSTTLQIAHINGETDVITFAPQPVVPASGADRVAALQAAFTTIVGFTRSNGKQALPTLVLPKTTKVTCTSSNDQGLPTHICNFKISAKDGTGRAIAYLSNGAKGKAIPMGIQRVWVSAVDKFSQQVSGSFVAIVLPPAPVMTITRVVNLGPPFSVDLSWAFWTGVSGYRVKRATVRGGPYTVIANLDQYTNSYSDASMPGATTYYVVTALLTSALYGLNYESAPSREVSTAPLSIGSSIGGAIGGVLVRSSNTGSSDYLMSNTSGVINIYNENATLATAAVSGSGTYIARCKSIKSSTVFATFGISYKASLSPSSVSAYLGYNLGVTPSIIFITRTTAGVGGTAQYYQSATLGAPLGFPIYFKLQRTGQYFFAYWSQDGSGWNPVGSGSVRISSMPDAGFVSLAIAGVSTCVADFDVNSFLP